MENKNLYFIGGVEGVGKTSITKKTAESLPTTIGLSASHIIRETSGVDNLSLFPFNQQARYLIIGLGKHLDLGGQRILLDAHYLCFSDNELYSAVENNFWANTNLFIHLNADPDQIYLRSVRDELNGVKNRDLNGLSLTNSIQEITRRQELSLKEAAIVAKNFNKPFFSLYNNSTINEAVLSLIKAIIHTEDKFRLFT